MSEFGTFDTQLLGITEDQIKNVDASEAEVLSRVLTSRIEDIIRENTTEVIDLLDSQKKIQELREKTDTLLTELDTQIKVSNATTMIEF